MPLRAVKPKTIKKRLKVLFYGAAKAGKTTAAISFPNAYLIDGERGAENDQYVELLESGGGVILQINTLDDLILEVKALLTEKHSYTTLIIDPLTTFYHTSLEDAADQVGTDYAKHYSVANRKMKHLINLLTRLDMNVILTAHIKNKYGQNMAIVGETFDCYAKLDYLLDLALEIQKRGDDRVAVVKLTRIKSFKADECFPFSYNEVAKRYGRDILEAPPESEKLATQEQAEQLKRLVDLLHIDAEIIKKWLAKASADSFEEMSYDDIQKCIDALQLKIEGKEDGN